MIVLHHLEHSRSQRILWLLEELGLPYEVKRYQRDPKTLLAPPDLKKVHPLGKSPVITDGQVTVAESAAIIEFILDRQDNRSLRLRPGTAEHLRYTYWMHYAEGSLMPILLLKLVFNRLTTSPMPFFIKPIVKGLSSKVHRAFIGPNLDLHLGYIESQLAQTGWFVGDSLTAADIQMSYPLEAASTRTNLAHYPHIEAFINRIRSRKAYQRALEKGGPVALPS